MVKYKNQSIQLIRIIAMFMIIFDHILGKVTFPMQKIIIQVLNSGVFIFLLLSGFLYGNKEIINWKKWFCNRFIKICIPLWIFMVIDLAIEAIVWNTFDIKYFFIYAFNLQGIFGVNIGGTNLWFLTLIMVCYMITPILQWIKSKKLNKVVAILYVVVAVVLQIILAYATDIGMVAGHTLSWCIIAIGMYVVGYFVGNIILSPKISTKRIMKSTVITVISSILVLFFNNKFDGQVIYDRIVVFYGMVIIDLWICTVIYKLGQYIKSQKLLRFINHLDTISYEFYIVHGLLIAILAQSFMANIGVMGYIAGIVLISYIAAWVLHGICYLINKKIK